ncbi:hypothetical protein AWT69_001259 [Pseudomonas putida]|nr:hypothetical protein AWT69_001259 [Pseudomonas putida]
MVFAFLGWQYRCDRSDLAPVGRRLPCSDRLSNNRAIEN